MLREKKFTNFFQGRRQAARIGGRRRQVFAGGLGGPGSGRLPAVVVTVAIGKHVVGVDDDGGQGLGGGEAEGARAGL